MRSATLLRQGVEVARWPLLCMRGNTVACMCVCLQCTKKQIKEAVSRMYDIQCKRVNTLIR